MVKIEELAQVTNEDLAAINRLIPQLSETAKPIAHARLLDMVQNRSMTALVARDGRELVGFGAIVIYNVPTEKRAWIEEVMVDEKYRGQGLGEKLSLQLIEIAKKERVNRIYLSSGPKRIAARKLYEKLGFEKKDTNVFKLTL